MKSFLPVLLLAALIFAGCTKPQGANQPPVAGSLLGTVAPAWKLQDVKGDVVTSEQFKGKVMVVDFWATWCPPCRQEIPGYVALQKKYGKDGVAIIGISLDEGGPAVVKEFVEKFGVDYQIVMGDQAIAEAYGVNEGIPTTFVIDRTGKIRDKKVGSEPTEEFEKRLVAVLK